MDLIVYVTNHFTFYQTLTFYKMIDDKVLLKSILQGIALALVLRICIIIITGNSLPVIPFGISMGFIWWLLLNDKQFIYSPQVK